jgi:hypothetical protein
MTRTGKTERLPHRLPERINRRRQNGGGCKILALDLFLRRFPGRGWFCLFLGAYWLGGLPAAWAGNLDTIGVTLLRASDPTLTGAGVVVAQAEAQLTANNDWEVNPQYETQPTNLFTWINTNGSAATFPNSLGIESAHADLVGSYFYSSYQGAAPGVAHVDNYEADYYYQFVIALGTATSDQAVNQSFVFDESEQTMLDSAYDTYAANTGILFASGVGNGGPVLPPGTAYDSIGVGAYGPGAFSSTGPTPDNGRSKPDLVGPGQETSFSTPYVSGAAAILLQAAARGDGGSNTSDATDLRTVKALLLNGAIKPFGWTHTSTAPLDTSYGAGVVNVFYSHKQLAAGQQPLSASTTVVSGSAHPPGSGTPLASLLGWDYQTITTLPGQDCVNHYYFKLAPGAGSNFLLTATLAWNRGADETAINQLGLFLYAAASGALAASSVSTVDNVQHLYVSRLAPGSYDLQVIKYGGITQGVTPSETYALAFQFYPVTPPALSISATAGAAAIWWPVSPVIFTLQQTADLSPPISWTAVAASQWITNDTVAVSVTPSGRAAFYRLAPVAN